MRESDSERPFLRNLISGFVGSSFGKGRTVADACRISGYYPSVHGAPVCVGDPSAIGIDDIMHPDYGDAPVLEPGDVPVFWACGVTPQAAVMASKPEFAITHAPGHMFITGKRDLEYMV